MHGLKALPILAAVLLGGCAVPGVGDFVDTGYGRVIQAIEDDVKRVEVFHDDSLRLGEQLVCGGSGPAPLRAYSGDQIRAWGCYCAAVQPELFAPACQPATAAPMPMLRPGG